MMSWNRRTAGTLLATLVLAVGCADDPGAPDFSDQIGLVPEDIKFEEPDPFVPGKDRLSLDVFYEGGRTETIEVNGFRNFYFPFGFLEFGQNSYFQNPHPNRVEGEQSDELTLAGTDFWGGGIIWEEPLDLSDWAILNVNFRSSDPSFARFDLSLLYISDSGEERSVVLNPADYGYANDGEWHFLEIPLEDAIARGFNIRQVRSPFVIGFGGGEAGDTLFIDNLYLTKF